MRTPQGGALRPKYSISGRNHVEYVDNFLMLLIQKSLTGKDDFDGSWHWVLISVQKHVIDC